MGGGLMQLVAYGAQDIYLTGNPQITFFKVVYRRHTNFAMEAIQQSFNGSLSEGNRVSCVVSRNGDLVHRMYLEVVLTGHSTGTSVSGANVTEVGNALKIIQNVFFSKKTLISVYHNFCVIRYIKYKIYTVLPSLFIDKLVMKNN